MNQHGFLLAGPMLYAAIGAGVVIVGLSVALKVQSSRLAAAQENLAACRATNAVLNDQIASQNAAVEAWEKAAEQAKDRAAKALRAANEAAKASKGEIERLKAAKPIVQGDCPAGQAVQRVREGLSK